MKSNNALILYLIIVTLLIILFATSQMCFAGITHDKIIIETIIYEGSGEPFEGQILIGEVIRNRAAKRHLSFEQICKQPKQFSCWNNNNNRKYTQTEYLMGKQAWEASQFSITGADHYCRTDCYPKWRYRMSVVKIIGNHIFLKS